jgi:hypothetical protein
MDTLISSFTILPATEADIPALAETLTWSHLSETIMPFFFPDWPRPDTILTYMTARIHGKFAEPHSMFYKAVDDASGSILGMVCMTLETGDQVLDRALTTAGGSFEPPKGFNWSFAKTITDALQKLDSFMVSKKHYSEFLFCGEEGKC